MELEIVFKVRSSLSARLLKKTARSVFSALPSVKQRKFVDKKIQIAVVSRKEALRLNRNYRHKHSPANVLSFNLEASPQAFPKEAGDDLAGIVVISPAVAKEQGIDSAGLVVHGLLHLFGYGHQDAKSARIMEAQQAKSLAAGKIIC